MMNIPNFIPVRQIFPDRPGVDVSVAIPRCMEEFRSKISPGSRIAIGVGSRGITGYREQILKLLKTIRESGAEPFLFPAMGSHGGGTESGQREVLASYGITETNMGCEIRCSMSVEEIGKTPSGIEVACSSEALRAHGILLINRIKPHTDFFGTLGSGLVKMSVVGLGKQVGATRFHLAAMQFGYQESLQAIAEHMLRNTPLLGGIAILEREDHQTAEVHGIPAEDLLEREPELLQKARAMMPTLPFETIDLLIIDEIGKNISGAGMDPNITHRSIHGYSSLPIPPDERRPFIKRIYVRDLTDETHGNGIGIGMADAISERLLSKLDREKTFRNALTALTPQSAKIPIVFKTDLAAIRAMLESLPLSDRTGGPRIVRIKNTLELTELAITGPLFEELRGTGRLRESDCEWPDLA
ncbi:MAG: [Fe-S]-binding protein [Pirellula sp.]|nr:[Fe-S]-binding protein [Pirellula sp.]